MENVADKLMDFVFNFINGVLIWFVTTILTKYWQNRAKKKSLSSENQEKLKRHKRI